MRLLRPHGGLAMTLFLVLALSSPARAALFSRDESVEEVQAHINRLPATAHRRIKARLYSQLGTLLYKKGRMVEAAAALEEALQYKAGWRLRRRIFVYLGKSYESHGRLDKAIAAYEQAAQLNRKDWRRHRDLAALYETVKLYRKAVESYQNALRASPKEATVYFQLGRTWRKLGLTNYAEADLVKARNFGHDKDAVNRELSFVYEGQGRFAEALSAFEKQVSPASPPEDGGRMIYLAYLAHNRTLASTWAKALKNNKVSRETVPFYEALVDLMDGPAGQALSFKTSDPSLQFLLESALRTQ